MVSKRRLYRDIENGKISGVCAGLSDYLDIDVTLIRVAFIIFAFTSIGLLVYIILLLMVDSKEKVLKKMREEQIDNNDDPFAKFD